MPKIKPIVCKTPEELAAAMGLSAAAAKEWRLQDLLLTRRKEIVLRQVSLMPRSPNGRALRERG
jgi:hypothetical protein